MFELPLQSHQPLGANDERFSDPAAWALVEKVAATPPSDTEAAAQIYGQLESDFLQAVPEIPLWYGGAWFQANTTFWQGYPSSTSNEGPVHPRDVGRVAGLHDDRLRAGAAGAGAPPLSQGIGPVPLGPVPPVPGRRTEPAPRPRRREPEGRGPKFVSLVYRGVLGQEPLWQAASLRRRTKDYE